ncbi:MAG TPA: FtsX-like permease family protein [Pyrinomonadaceae bacterium]|nr:FtsX-like permease family protein [Pyrinomonadaceae bacterium]
MPFLDLLRLALRNLREAKLRAVLTTMGVVVGVAVIVTMVSFGLGLQRNTVDRFRERDLFNEIRVLGRNISSLVETELNRRAGDGPQQGGDEKAEGTPTPTPTPARTLDDAAIAEIERMPGVAYAEPNFTFTAYVRANGRTRRETIGGARVPNAASRFKNFSAGAMISAPEAEEVVVDSEFLKEFGFESPEAAVGQTVELLAPPEGDTDDGGKEPDAKKQEQASEAEDGEPVTFFGIPLEEGGAGEVGTDEEANNEEASTANLVARPFRIAGVLKDEIAANDEPGGGRRFRGMMPESGLYVPLPAAREWAGKNRDLVREVALRLARESGVIAEDETEGYQSAVVRVTDPAVSGDVSRRLKEAGFNAFSFLDQLDELRTVFLVINSALGLLGGISLLVASFGIANTMIMSIFERTREIGIMKAIGAEDREIKFIFFFEAAVIGLAGGTIGVLVAIAIDKLANQLAFKFILEPQGVNFINFFSLPAWLWLGAILFATLISVAAALYPASRAARIDPVRALRHD